MGTKARRLPRGSKAEPPGPGEVVRKRTGADLQNGWLGRHGTLSLTDDRVVFIPTRLDSLMRARRWDIPLDALLEIERYPRSPDGMIPGGMRPRMILSTAECGYELMVGDLDAWIDSFEIVYARRAKHGKPHVPLILREGSTTALLEEV